MIYTREIWMIVSETDIFVAETREKVNSFLSTLVKEESPASLREGMIYSLKNGGKRLRPLLTIAAAKTFGKNEDEVLDLACAVELVHTYSLIHDDLPAMDNSDLRRGKPSCHIVFGEAVAILVGDALLTLAFETISQYGLKHGEEKTALEVCSILSQSAGCEGMVGGQVLDLEGEGAQLNRLEIEKIANLKTGKIITSAVIIGAVAGGASIDELEILKKYSKLVGFAFQVVDDLLDYDQTPDKPGKPVGLDQAVFKATIPALIGTVQARELAEDLFKEAIICLNELERPAGLLEDMAYKMIYRKK